MKIPVFDLHADTYTKNYLKTKNPYNDKLYLKKDDGSFKKLFSENMINSERLKEGNVKLQTQSLFYAGSSVENPLHTALKTINLILKDLKKDNYFKVDSIEDLNKNLENDKTGILISIEGLEIINNDIGLLDIFKELGVKMVAPSWNRMLPFAGSVMENCGILTRGKNLAKKINDLNLIFDVSHLSEQSFFDFHDLIETPFIASHSNVKSLNSHIRNLSNDQLKVLQERDSIFGINFSPTFIATETDKSDYPIGFEYIYKIIDFVASKFSVDMIAFGSDFDGISSIPKGIEDPSCFPKLAEFLKDKGVSTKDIEKIFYKNALRVFKKIL